jgi:hypothetical protein
VSSVWSDRVGSYHLVGRVGSLGQGFLELGQVLDKKIMVRTCRRLDPGGVPGPTSKLSPRVPAQMGRRETEHEGGKGTCKRGNSRPSCCPAPRSGALAVGGYKRLRGRERETYASARSPARPTFS